MTLAPNDRLIDAKELRRMVPFTRQYILKLEKRGAFPQRRRIGQRRVAWLLSDVQNWIETRAPSRPVDSQMK